MQSTTFHFINPHEEMAAITFLNHIPSHRVTLKESGILGYISDCELHSLITTDTVEKVRHELSVNGSGLAVVDIPSQLYRALRLDEDEGLAMVQFLKSSIDEFTFSIFNDLPESFEPDTCYPGDKCRHVVPPHL